MDEREDFARKMSAQLKRAGLDILIVLAVFAAIFLATAKRYHGY